MKNKIKKIVKIFFLIIISILIVGSVYYRIKFKGQEFEELLFSLTTGVQYSSPKVVLNVILTCFIPVIIVFLFLKFVTKKDFITANTIEFKIKNKKITFSIFPIKHRKTFYLFLTIIALLFVCFGLKIDNYIKNNINDSKIFDHYYINGKDVSLTFPENKRNLIIIFAESMESSLVSKENGGGLDVTYIPELESLALKNINFSNTSKIGGALNTACTNYTATGLVSQTSGVPIKVPVGDANTYLGNGKYLEAVHSLGDILETQGYNLEMMMGSNGHFGGREEYFTANGNYKIFDLAYAEEQGKMTKDEEVWWGFEDDKLFEWSKEEILNLASQDKPFNYILLTVDTHFPNGYVSKNVENKFDSQYANVFAYSSKSIYRFVSWIQKQDFYKNTTVVILGDHLGMQTDFYDKILPIDYTRTVYNCFINSVTEPVTKKNRTFSTLDIYPSILASIGIKIEGERIGLGTNLFSNKQTLSEELGHEYLSTEIKKFSSFYNQNILGTDYYVMKKNDRNN